MTNVSSCQNDCIPHAIILAAGRGSRLGQRSKTPPKPLLSIENETLISRLVRQVMEIGIKDIHVVVGHARVDVQNEVLKQFGGSDVRFYWIENREFATTNNIVSLVRGLDSVNGVAPMAEVLLLECDVYLDDCVLPRLGAVHEDIALVSPFAPGMDGTVVRLKGHSIDEFIPASRQGEDFDYSGAYKTVNVYKFTPKFWNPNLLSLLNWYVQNSGVDAFYEHIVGLLSQTVDKRLVACVIDGSEWAEVDDQSDLRKARIHWDSDFMGQEISTCHGGFWDFQVVDFSYLRNMYFPPFSLTAQLSLVLVESLTNYGSSQQILDKKMSWWIDSTAESTVALPGLSACYPILETIVRPDRVLIPSPTFGEYPSRFPGATTYDSSSDISLLADTLADTKVEFLVIVNPNNPTGRLFRTSDILSLAQSFPEVNILVDESFIGFSRQPSLVEYPMVPANIVVMSSLSKTMGVPGLRLGYLWSRNFEFLSNVRRKLPVWGCSALAERFLEFSLKYRAEFESSLGQTLQDREAFREALEQIPFLKIESHSGGNFVLAKLTNLDMSISPLVWKALLQRKFLVKDVTDRVHEGCPVFRIAVRLPEENCALVAAFRDTIETACGKGGSTTNDQ